MSVRSDRLAMVAGAGGFIGGHLVASLLDEGVQVRAVDIKPLERWEQVHLGSHNLVVDLRLRDGCEAAVAGATEVYNLASDMGGMGFIAGNRAACMRNVLIDAHLLDAVRDLDLDSYFYASSACVYPARLQDHAGVEPLREEDVYPAEPEDGYGWEKLFGERLCLNHRDDYATPVRIARYHNVYGPRCTWDGGREKVPAAICRKVAEAVRTGRHEIEIWGDGEQTRSFVYIDDCIAGTRRLAASEVDTPLNIGSSELVSINALVDLVCAIAGVELERFHDLAAPQGVRGRNSDNTRIRSMLGWAPSIGLRTGLEATYAWIEEQVARRHP